MIDASQSENRGLIHVVDDDAALAGRLSDQLRGHGFDVDFYRSPAAFVQGRRDADASCLLLSVEFPTANGLDFQELLPAVGIHAPVILMTGRPDIQWSIRGLKAGAVDFLLKPLRDEEVLSSVQLAMKKARDRHAEDQKRSEAEGKLARLTRRERQVMDHVVSGLMNKQIAGLLGLSEITVKLHRGGMMRKLGVRTVPDLVRLAGVPAASSYAH